MSDIIMDEKAFSRGFYTTLDGRPFYYFSGNTDKKYF